MPSLSEKKEEVLEGLLRQEKSLPPKYFYDERGSKLFDQITDLPEYYITTVSYTHLTLPTKA